MAHGTDPLWRESDTAVGRGPQHPIRRPSENAEGPGRLTGPFLVSTPDRIRTGATAVRGRRARPLHNGGMHTFVELHDPLGPVRIDLRDSSETVVAHQIATLVAISLGY